MPLLAYCILLDSRPTNFPSEGILGSHTASIEESGLIALSSEMERNAISTSNFQQAALEFHRVVQAVFARKAVVPFRFPTWLSAMEMKEHLRQQSSRYKDFLIRHADHVQMEVRIASQESIMTEAATGAEHLRIRAAQFRAVSEHAKQLKHQLADIAIEWRERENPADLRLYALVSRTLVDAFREKLNRISVRASGPWPATEFFESPPAKD